jgi:hypothetical protein
MSRVVLTETVSTADQHRLRSAHGVRAVKSEEEGTGVDALPEGVYGFTYSPGLPNAPLFADRRYRSFEIHKVAGRGPFIIGFATPQEAQEVASSESDVNIVLHPEPEAEATTLVAVPYSRIQQHRQHASPNQRAMALVVGR